jgi:hypothetical protein
MPLDELQETEMVCSRCVHEDDRYDTAACYTCCRKPDAAPTTRKKWLTDFFCETGTSVQERANKHIARLDEAIREALKLRDWAPLIGVTMKRLPITEEDLKWAADQLRKGK